MTTYQLLIGKDSNGEDEIVEVAKCGRRVMIAIETEDGAAAIYLTKKKWESLRNQVDCEFGAFIPYK